RLDGIAFGPRLFQASEHDDTQPTPRHRAAGPGIERATVAVGGVDPSWLVEVADRLRHARRHAARQSDVAFAPLEALAGEVDGHQRRGAGRLNADARPTQVQFVGDTRTQEVLVASGDGLQIPDALPGRRGMDAQRVLAQAGPREDTDAAGVRVGVVP